MRTNSAGNSGARWLRHSARRVAALVAAAALLLAPLAWADRTRLKPGWNLFSPQQDVQVGEQVSRDAERQLPMLNDRRVDNYLNNLGQRLASHAPGERFPYQFKVVNAAEINAFALPGGHTYINRGVIEAADNEAQLAGVIAHEISHTALRHGTNQASKAYVAQVPLAVLGGALGNSVGGLVAQLGAGFALNSVLLKYSRNAESQADVLGTQILYDSGYDPRAMAQFFEKIQAENKGKNPPEFFSNHPNPENRIERVTQEVASLGGPPRGYRTDSAEFRDIKRYVMSLPPPPKAGRTGARPSGGSRRPEYPSDRYLDFQNDTLRIRYPDNWRAYGQGNAATIVPEAGIVDDGRGNNAVAYGMIISVFEPDTNFSGNVTLVDATDQLIEDLHRSNPNLRVVRRHERVRMAGAQALSTYLSNNSPVGGRETDWLVTVQRPEGLVYFVCVAPDNEYSDYERAFQTMLDSVRFRQ